ncbi:SpaH/EbpB family LPXTG-anchored major pilin [Leucobacter sp. GX24907]
MRHQDRGSGVRKVLAVIGTASLILFGAVAGSTAASAEVSPANMPTGNGKLTIHKYEQPAGETPDATGNPLDPVPTDWEAMNDVPFKVERITNVDLTTNAGWDQANAYAANPASIPAANLVEVANAETAGGVVGPLTLPIGAYLVTELDMTGGNIVHKAAPFVVTIPLPDEATKGWITDVHVYPKNSVAEVDKDVTAPDAYGLGETVTWPIDVKIPTLPPNMSFTSFSISDTLDDRLAYEDYTLQVDGTDVPAAAVSVTEPTAATGGTFGAVFDVSHAFLTTNAGKTITLVLTTTVVGPVHDGVIENVANVDVNGNEFAPDSFSRWGDLLILKIDEAERPLAGATFQVFAGECGAEGGVGTAISVTAPGGAAASEFTSSSSGVVHIAGLWVGDENNDVTERDYCVEETAAPAGYDLADPAYQTVTVVAGTTEEGEYDATFVNPQKPPVALPLTGSTGTALFMAGGLALMLLAGGVALIASKRKKGRIDRVIE